MPLDRDSPSNPCYYRHTMFSKRSEDKELIDDLTLSDPIFKINLDEMDRINRWFGTNVVLMNGLKKSLKRIHPSMDPPLVIADIGCGSGDALRLMSLWAEQANIPVKLIGLDANLTAIAYAKERSTQFSNINYIHQDILSKSFQAMTFDVVCLNNFYHHLSDEKIIESLRKLCCQTKYAIIINDLHRHMIAYFFIKGLSWLFNWSYLVRNDGPLSVLRAFKRADLKLILEQLPVCEYKIKWKWAFRWQVIVWCKGKRCET